MNSLKTGARKIAASGACLLIAISHANALQPARADQFAGFSRTLERMCDREFVTMEHARACKTGGILVFGAPQAEDMAGYLVLLDQCTATYQDAGAQFAPAITAAELRAACQTGLVWARAFLQE